ncbi:MAG: HAD-IIIC family phosphatase [Nitrospirae bacterium]|nr:HAD-IIIC family phosphatase [Nitrospirota bacterium]
MKELKYFEILKKNKEIQGVLSGDKYNVAVISNMIVVQVKEILEYSIRLLNINAFVEIGNFDNIVQESLRFCKNNLCVIFWELANVIEGLSFKAELFDDDGKNQIIEKVKMEIDMMFMNLRDTPLVLINKFSTLMFNSQNVRTNTYDKICDEINRYIETKKNPNTVIVDIDRVLARISIDRSIDFRNYYSSKSIYTVEFYKEYVMFINPVIASVNGKGKKVLVFDCDNTLWSGIIGEDGANGIDMSSNTARGSVFNEIQHIALSLNKKGVLLGICSKNNEDDVDEVLKTHPDMKIRNENLTVKKVNWDDKTINLSAVSTELNIGIDSMVFVDDSAYELGFVVRCLPEITTLQVPMDIYRYPNILRETASLFYKTSESAEDSIKVRLYQEQSNRYTCKDSFECVEDYLKSLSLKMKIFVNDITIVPRMAQLTQKTNQFNLTTQRYTETDIRNFIKDENSIIFALEVEDKFGNYGITGLAIVKLRDGRQNAEIDSFLVSCRIIGRNIEFAFFDYIYRYLLNIGVKVICGIYKKTIKNKQVSDFYDKLCFSHIENKDNTEQIYSLNVSAYTPMNVEYIEVLNERKN